MSTIINTFTGSRFKRCLAMVLCLCMVLSMAPVPTFAAGICEHHPVHTPECGYVAAVAGQACQHQHDASCGYQEAAACGHWCGDGLCGYVPAQACGHYCGDGLCNYQAAVGCNHVCGEACAEGCTHFCGDGTCSYQEGRGCDHVHGGCGYQEGRNCDHVHSAACGYREYVPCAHVNHDASCGYVEAVAGHDCGFVCDICNGTAPQETVPEVTTPEGTVPEETTPEVTTPEVTTPEGTIPEQTTPEVTTPEVTTPETTVPEETVPEETIPEESQAAECICDVKCNPAAATEGCDVCALDPSACQGEEPETQPEDVIITAWSWVDEEELIDPETNELIVSFASAEQPLVFDELVAFLPYEIVAQVDGAENVLELGSWTSADYPMDTGAFQGTYLLQTTLPQGYVLAEGLAALQISVVFAHDAALYNEEHTHTYDNGICTVPGCTSPYMPADGDSSNYQIGNAGQLFWFAEQVNVFGQGSINGQLTANITMPSGREWTPIGSITGTSYSGTFDGMGKTIDGLTFNNTDYVHAGLFGYSGGTIRNVTLTNASITGKEYVGGICGTSKGTIENCHFNGTVSASSDRAGAICGKNSYGTILMCTASGSVTVKDYAGYAGGICGELLSDGTNGKIIDCVNNSSVTSKGSYAGGICSASGGLISGCANYGTVVASMTRAGGICGEISSGSVKNCLNRGSVSASNYGGGICGFLGSSATIERCCNVGSVNGSGYALCGESNGSINNCLWQGSGSDEVSEEKFRSGWACWWLNNGANPNVWGQNIGVDTYPSLGGPAVYRIRCADVVYYTNDAHGDVDADIHNFNDDGLCTNCGTQAVADVDGEKYLDIQSALKAAQDKGVATLKLLADASLSSGYCQIAIYARGLTLNLNGHDLNGVSEIYLSINESTLIIQGEGKISYIQDGTDCYPSLNLYGSYNSKVRATISGGTFGNVNVSGYGANLTMTGGTVNGFIQARDNATVNISGGTVHGLQARDNATVNISGGTVNGGIELNELGYITVNGGTVNGEIRLAGTGVTEEDTTGAGTIYIGGDCTIASNIIAIYNANFEESKVIISGGIFTDPNLQISICLSTENAVIPVSIGGGSFQGLKIESVGYTLRDLWETGYNWFYWTGNNRKPFTQEEAAVSEVSGAFNLQYHDHSYGNFQWVDDYDHVKYCTVCGMLDNDSIAEHWFVEGFCTDCGAYERPEQFDDYYRIRNAGQLFWFAELCNKGETYRNARLVDDIRIPEGHPWTPIEVYQGYFDGNGHSISGLQCHVEGDAGLFARIQGGSVTDLSILNSSISGANAGAICAVAEDGDISRCYSEANVTGEWNVGSLVGELINSRSFAYCGTDRGNLVGRMVDCRPRSCYGVEGLFWDDGGNNYFYNCYYQSEEATGGQEGLTPKTLAQFRSGEVTYLLNGDQRDIVWKQTLGAEDYPSFIGLQVYPYQQPDCAGGSFTCYSNDMNYQPTGVAHNFNESLVCTKCGETFYYQADGTEASMKCTILTQEYLEAHDYNVTGNFVVVGELTAKKPITVVGGVNLVLADGCTFTAEKGINVSRGNSLTIYGQKNGTGMLNASGSDTLNAGIGSKDNQPGGDITINGGTVIAVGGIRAAGIGGGQAFGGGGSITINGGSVTATGSVSSAGIGGGDNGRGWNITITGGTVTAANGYSIGDGSGSGSTFSTGVNGHATIYAGSIKATTNQEEWSGIIYQGDKGQVYGNLNTDIVVPADKKLLIPENTTLNGNVTVTDNGTVYVAGQVRGTLSGNGNVYYALRLINCTATGEGVVSAFNDTFAKPDSQVNLTPGAAPSGQTFVDWDNSDVISVENNSFIMTIYPVTIEANFANIVATVTAGGVTTNYTDIQVALDAANNATGSTLTLMTNVTTTGTLGVTGEFTLDLNGFTLENTADNVINVAHYKAELTICDSSEDENKIGAIKTSNEKFAVKNQGELTISGGSLEGRGAVLNIDSGKVTIEGGRFKALDFERTNPSCCVQNNGEYANAVVTIKGGTFERENQDDYVFSFRAQGSIQVSGGTFVNGVKVLRGTPYDVLANGYAYFDAVNNLVNGSQKITQTVTVGDHSTHGFTYNYLNDNQHTATCGCGYSEQQNHVNFDETHTFCPCGYAQYITADGEPASMACTILTEEYLKANDLTGNFLVVGDLTAAGRITVNGTVNLVLADGCTFTALQGINVGGSNSLIIYGQKNGTGELEAHSEDGKAGIGSEVDKVCGAITINGGTVGANGGNRAAGIGGGKHGGAGTITINGGTVTASGGYMGAGIGAGDNGRGGTIIIHGGRVVAIGNTMGAGIGGSNSGGDCNITITDGTVTANGYNGIGVGREGHGVIFSTGDSGRATIYARSIEATTNQEEWSGIIYQGNVGQVYGTPNTDIVVPAGKKLLIPQGTDLDVSNVTVTNNGGIYVAGSVTGELSGDVYYPLNLINCTASGDGVDEAFDGTFAMPGQVNLTPKALEGKMFADWESGSVEIDANNSFTMPKNAVTIEAKFVDIVATVTAGDVPTNYADIQAAFDAANNATGSTLTLMKDVTTTQKLEVTGEFTLDLNGFALINTEYDAIEVWGTTAKLTICDSSENKTGAIKASNQNVAVRNYGTLTISGGSLEGKFALENRENGIVTISGGHFKALDSTDTTVSFCVVNISRPGNNAVVTISGGTFERENQDDYVFGFHEQGSIQVRGGTFKDGVSVLNILSSSDGVPLDVLAKNRAYFDWTDTLVDGSATITKEVTVGEHQEHSFTYNYLNENQHTATCGCGYSVTEIHVDINGTQTVCPCGYTWYWDGTQKVYLNCTILTEEYLYKCRGELPEGNYVVQGDAYFLDNIMFAGKSKLILADGCTFEARKSINVYIGTLSIYGQTLPSVSGQNLTQDNKAGILRAFGYNTWGYPETAISGNVNIYGGAVMAESPGTGIGGGYGSRDATVNIYDGYVRARSQNGAAIGSGVDTSGTVKVNIQGGTVVALAHNGPAIGTCASEYGEYNVLDVTIGGGKVYAYSGSDFGIGKGERSTVENVNISITGGDVTASGYLGAFSHDPTLTGNFRASVADSESGLSSAAPLYHPFEDGSFVTNQAAWIRPCTKHDYSGYSVDDQFHQRRCVWCGFVEKYAHSFDTEGSNGFCTVCGAYEPAKLVENSYEIANAGQLFWFAALVNTKDDQGQYPNAGAKGHLKDGCTIDLGGRSWTPIANEHEYSGTFDGKGGTITGLYVSGEYAGLFGNLKGGTIQNLTVDGSVYGTSVGGGICAWVIVGKIINCHNSVSVMVECSQNPFAGGICGSIFEGEISRCSNTGDITAIAGEHNNIGYAGGIAGAENQTTIEDCWNSGTIDSVRGYAGGICGYSDTSISNCYHVTGSVIGSLGSGPIVGKPGSSNPSNCYYLGNEETDDCSGTTFMTEKQFNSGEVAWLLQANRETTVWGQSIGKDNFPVLGGQKVYQTAGCPAYSNNEIASIDHHSPDVNGFCQNCGAALEASVTDEEGNVSGYRYLFDALKVAISKNGSTLKLLKNVTTTDTLEVTGGKFTLDLNGFTLENTANSAINVSYFRAELTICDSSKNKSGAIKAQGQYFAVSNSGKLTINSGYLEGRCAVTNSDGGQVTINGGHFKALFLNNSNFSYCVENTGTSADAKVTVTGGTFERENHDNVSVFTGDVQVSGGTFLNGISLSGGNKPFTVLAEGYAFYENKENGKVLNGSAEINVTAVVREHDHDNVYSSIDDSNHKVTCICGKEAVEPHRFNVNGICADCGVALAASVTVGEETYGYVEFERALNEANRAQGSTLTLLRDVELIGCHEIRRGFILDLNGKTLDLQHGIILQIAGTEPLTVRGAAQGSTLKLSGSGDSGKSLDFKSGKLTLESGDVRFKDGCSLIVSSGGELLVSGANLYLGASRSNFIVQDNGTVTISGGSVTGGSGPIPGIDVNGNGSLTINGGAFKSNVNGNAFLIRSANAQRITITGGSFPGGLAVSDSSGECLKDLLGKNENGEIAYWYVKDAEATNASPITAEEAAKTVLIANLTVLPHTSHEYSGNDGLCYCGRRAPVASQIVDNASNVSTSYFETLEAALAVVGNLNDEQRMTITIRDKLVISAESLTIPEKVNVNLEENASLTVGTLYLDGTVDVAAIDKVHATTIYGRLRLKDCTLTSGEHIANQDGTYYIQSGDPFTLEPNLDDGEMFIRWILSDTAPNPVNNTFTMLPYPAVIGVEKAAIVATVTVDGQTTTYPSLIAAFNAASGREAVIELKKDDVLEQGKIIQITSKITLKGQGTITCKTPGVVDSTRFWVKGGEFILEGDGVTLDTNVTVWNGTCTVNGANLGFLDVSGGSATVIKGNVEVLSVTKNEEAGFNGTASLSGGTFKVIAANGMLLADLLEDGYAYYVEGNKTWVDANNGENDDYLTTATGSIIVKKVPVSFTTQPTATTTMTYGVPNKLTAVATSGVPVWYEGNTQVGTGSELNLSTFNAGEHTFFCQVTVDGYTAKSQTAKVTINPRALTVQWQKDLSFTYNGQQQCPKATAGNLVNNDKVTLTVEGAQTDAGTDYIAEVTAFTAGEGTLSGNYMLPIESQAKETTFSIIRKELNVASAVAKGRVYNGSHTVEVTEVRLDGIVEGDAVAVNLNGVSGELTGKDVGDYTQLTLVTETDGLSLTGAHASNYQLVQPQGTVTCNTVTISPKTIKINSIEVNNKTYDGTDVANITGVNFEGVVKGDALQLINYVGKFDSASAGTGKTVSLTGVELDGTSKANYALPDSTTWPTTNANIDKAKLTVNVVVADKQYDGLKTATISSAELVDVLDCDKDKVTLTNGTATFDSKDVKDKIAISFTDFSISGEAIDNYTLTQPTGITASIYNSFEPKENTEFTTNSDSDKPPVWLREDLVIKAMDGYELSLTNSAEGTWSKTLVVDTDGTGTLEFYVRNTNTGAISKMVKKDYWVDQTKPSGVSIMIGSLDATNKDAQLYLNDNVTVTITGEDATSGVAQVFHLLSAVDLTTELEDPNTRWVEKAEFSVEAADAASFRIYTKVVDAAGNVAYFQSARFDFDKTDPEITGVEDGETYYTTQTATVNDTNLDKLTLNDKDVKSPITLDGVEDKETTYTITAIDKAGNSTTFTVTMKPLSDFAGDNEIVTEDGETLNGETVEKGDKSNLESAKKALEEMLSKTATTDNEKGLISDLLGNINDALNALKNVQAVEDEIKGIKTPVEPDDADKEQEIIDARKHYGDLTDHEESLVDKDVLKQLEALEKALVAYKFVSGDGGSWSMGSGVDFTLQANGPMRKFTGVKLDDKLLDASNYTATDDRTTITLGAAFMQNLSLGEHKIQLIYSDGESKEGSFQVKQSESYLDLTGNPDFEEQTKVFIDGVSYPVEETGGKRYVNLPDTGDLITTFTYSAGDEQDSYSNYPTSMTVHIINRSPDGTTVTNIPELYNLLQYSGCSIRITGNRGIRMITSISDSKKLSLIGAGLAGFKLVEYGTVVSWKEELGENELNLETGKHNYAFKLGVADPVFNQVGGMTQYTNVLVGFDLAECSEDIIMRPYITLKDGEGNLHTLYGGCVTRSISYIAWQNRDTYAPGTPAYDYVHELMALYKAA